MPVTIKIPELGELFQDYRDDIAGDAYGWGPAITTTNIRAFTFHHSVTAQQLSMKKLNKFKGDPNSLGDDNLPLTTKFTGDPNSLGDDDLIIPKPKTAVAWKNPQTAIKDGNWRKEVDAIVQIHLNNGWGGIGYRFVICSNGVVAYVGDLGRGGSAVGGMNDVMFSACFVGDFTKQLPTAVQVHSAYLLANWFLLRTPQYPNLKTWDQIKGHKDFAATACPGTNWTTPGDSLRTRILQDNWKGYPAPQPNVAAPAPIDPCAAQNTKIQELNTKNGQLETQLKLMAEDMRKLNDRVTKAKELAKQIAGV